MKILFMGTPQFAKGCLQRLVEDSYEVCGVFTQSDKPRGRGHKMEFTPVKEYALSVGLPVFQPLSLKDDDTMEIISNLNPDLIIVVAYGKLLPLNVLNYPEYGCVNIHGSLLPKYRGAAPIQWSILNGDKETGITSMYMAKGLDTGDMILKTKTLIGDNETSGELFKRMEAIACDNLVETIELIKKGEGDRVIQNEFEATYAPMLTKEMGLIDFTKPAKTVHNQIRGLNPWPVAYTFLNDKRMKIYESELGEEVRGEKGQVVNIVKGKGMQVACKNGSIYIKTIQFDGKKQMSVDDYLRGNSVEVGEILG